MMYLTEAINRRNSTREFSGRMIMPEVITKIVHNALNVYKLNEDFKCDIAILTHDCKTKKYVADSLVKYGNSNKDQEAIDIGKCIDTASCLILLYIDLEKSQDPDSDLITLGALGQNICLLAAEQYLGTLCTDKVIAIKHKIDNRLTKYEDYDLCYGILLGYKDKVYSYKKDSIPTGICLDWRN